MPLLTLLVPTKNRPHTAVMSVTEAAKIGSRDELEIVVHDCSDESELRDRLAEAGLLDRVVYRYAGRPLSMTENWNCALECATGEWIIFIGDDDTIVPGILEAARWGSSQGLDAVKARRYSAYGHPDHPLSELAATLHVAPFAGGVAIVDPAKAIPAAAQTGDRYMDLPMVYHNLVRRSLMERLRAKTGHYFDGLAPDIYSAFAIAATIDRMGVVDYPLSIFGTSARANSGRQNVGLTYLHMAEYGEHEYSWMTPDSHILLASIPDNVVRALTAVGRTDLLEHMDVPRVFARTIRAEPKRAREHLRKYVSVLRKQRRSVPRGVAVISASLVAKYLLDAFRKVRGASKDSAGTWYSNVETLGAAIELQVQWLREHGIAPPAVS